LVARRDKATGRVERTIDYEFERTREAPSGRATRSLHPPLREGDKTGVDGLSRWYMWGPQAPYLAEVLPDDAQLISTLSVGSRFRDVTDLKGPLGPPGSRSLKQYYRAGLVRKLDDSLHEPAANMVRKRLGLTPKLVLPPGVALEDDDDDDET
jgi:hypothetical protein